jgi:glycerophosphoryl diester phosphodiesterase
MPGHVPLLQTVLLASHGMTVNIEIKNLPTEPNHDPEELAARGVGKLVAELGAVDRVIVSSFWMASLDAVRHALPEMATGLLVASWFDPDAGLAMARQHDCTAVHPHVTLVSASLVEEAHGAGLAVTPWTVNDRGSLEAMAAFGVDTVITDDVGLAVDTLHGS